MAPANLSISVKTSKWYWFLRLVYRLTPIWLVRLILIMLDKPLAEYTVGRNCTSITLRTMFKKSLKDDNRN